MSCQIYVSCVCEARARNGNNSMPLHCMVSVLDETVQEREWLKLLRSLFPSTWGFRVMQAHLGHLMKASFPSLSCVYLAHLDLGVSLEDRNFLLSTGCKYHNDSLFCCGASPHGHHTNTFSSIYPKPNSIMPPANLPHLLCLHLL